MRYVLKQRVESEQSAHLTAIIALAYWTGLRISEIANLRHADGQLNQRSGAINPNYYEMGAWQRLREGARAGDIALPQSRRYRAFEDDLLSRAEWAALRRQNETRLLVAASHAADSGLSAFENVGFGQKFTNNRNSALAESDLTSHPLCRPGLTLGDQRALNRFFQSRCILLGRPTAHHDQALPGLNRKQHPEEIGRRFSAPTSI